MSDRAGAPLVLVVDDEPDLVEIVSDRLTASGYRVVAARDGVEALACLARERPACIVLDLKMPRLGGFEALPLLRRAAPEAHIVVLTGSPNRPLAATCRSRGADDFLLKPFDAGELLRRLAHFMGRERGA